MNYPAPGSTPPGGGYSGYQPGPPRRPTWLWVALAVAVVVIVVLAVVVVIQMRAGQPGTPTSAAPPTGSTSVSALPPSTVQPPSTGSARPMTCEGYAAQVDPGSRPGWQPTVGKRGLAYAAPPDWTVAACGVQIGWQKPCPDGQQGVCAVRAMSTASTLPDPQCESGNLAMAGVAGSQNPDIRAALEEESTTVPRIYTSQSGQVPEVELGPVREFAIGSHPAVQVVAKITGVATQGCTGPEALHSMVVTTVPNVEGSVVFLISLRQGAPGALSADVINEMVDTLKSPA